MLSRVAERIYWMARYIERAENTARLINVNTHLILDVPRRISLGWWPIIEIMGLAKGFKARFRHASERNVVRFLVSDRKNPSCILNALEAARENARTIRDTIPNEAWEQLNELHLATKAGVTTGLSQRNRFEYLDSVIGGAQQLTGLLAGTMTHDFGYDFLRIGRNLERADMTTRIIEVRAASPLPQGIDPLEPYEHVQWLSVLRSLSAHQMYQRQVQQPVRRADVMEFLVKDAQFPRAVAHCIEALDCCFDHLPRNRELLRLNNKIKKKIVKTEPGQMENRDAVVFMDELQIELAEVHGCIYSTYFSGGAD